MKTIWLVELYYHHESGNILGAYSTEELALQKVAKELENRLDKDEFKKNQHKNCWEGSICDYFIYEVQINKE